MVGIVMLGILDPKLRTRVRDSLESQKYIWTGQRLDMFATKHQIDIKSGSVPKITYRKGINIWDVKTKILRQQIRSEVIKPFTSERSSAFIFFQNED